MKSKVVKARTDPWVGTKLLYLPIFASIRQTDALTR